MHRFKKKLNDSVIIRNLKHQEKALIIIIDENETN